MIKYCKSEETLLNEKGGSPGFNSLKNYIVMAYSQRA